MPAPHITVVGETPIGLALASLGDRLRTSRWRSARGDPQLADDAALVVASHGRAEESALAAALHAGVPYVGLVASRKRGAAVLDTLRADGVPEELIKRLRTPAGLNIGAVTPEEIALSILAEIVATRRQSPQITPAARAAAVDPVCGMTVAITVDTPQAEHAGGHRLLLHGGLSPGVPGRSRPLHGRGGRRAEVSKAFVTGLVLAAGGSLRLGRPKQLLPFGDRTLLEHVVATACDSCPFDQLVVALGGQRR